MVDAQRTRGGLGPISDQVDEVMESVAASTRTATEAAIAAWNVSETSASASFEPTFLAGERHGFDEVVRVYRRIEVDERFHVGLGRRMLSRYAETDADRAEILRAMRGMRDIAWRTFTPESVAHGRHD